MYRMVFKPNLTCFQGPDLAIHQPDEILDAMNDWCKVNHGKSGLTERSRKSTISLQDAEEQASKQSLGSLTFGEASLRRNAVGKAQYSAQISEKYDRISNACYCSS